MCAEERHLQESLFVLQRFFQCSLAYRALGDVDETDHHFFRLAKGALMKDAVVDWCKLFGNSSEYSNWTRLFSDEKQTQIKEKLDQSVRPRCRMQVRREVKDYRDKFVAHLDAPDRNRPEVHLNLEGPLAMARVIYREVWDELTSSHGSVSANGFVRPDGVEDGPWLDDLARWGNMLARVRAVANSQGMDS